MSAIDVTVKTFFEIYQVWNSSILSEQDRTREFAKLAFYWRSSLFVRQEGRSINTTHDATRAPSTRCLHILSCDGVLMLQTALLLPSDGGHRDTVPFETLCSQIVMFLSAHLQKKVRIPSCSQIMRVCWRLITSTFYMSLASTIMFSNGGCSALPQARKIRVYAPPGFGSRIRRSRSLSCIVSKADRRKHQNCYELGGPIHGDVWVQRALTTCMSWT